MLQLGESNSISLFADYFFLSLFHRVEGKGLAQSFLLYIPFQSISFGIRTVFAITKIHMYVDKLARKWEYYFVYLVFSLFLNDNFVFVFLFFHFRRHFLRHSVLCVSVFFLLLCFLSALNWEWRVESGSVLLEME